jgi:16S rRNA (guanine1207-N2)-methyltransferase
MNMQKQPAEHYYTRKPKAQAKYALIRVWLRGREFEFLTTASVFSAKRVDAGTRLLIENMQLPEEGKVLDLGCGYGAVGTAAAAFNPKVHVTMTDVNKRAVKLATLNARRNRTANVTVKYGPLYAPVAGELFNCILTNPPISAGMKTVKAVITQAPQHMTQHATLQMVTPSKIGAEILPETLRQTFGNMEILARESGYRILKAQKQHS